MSKTLMQQPSADGSFHYLLDLADADDEVSVFVPPQSHATVQIYLRVGATIGNITIKVQPSNDGVNSTAFSTAVTFTASGLSDLLGVGGVSFLHVLNSAAAISTGTGYADVYIRFHRSTTV